MQELFQNKSLRDLLVAKELYPAYIAVLVAIAVSVGISYYLLSKKTLVNSKNSYVVAEISGAVVYPGVYKIESANARVSSLVDLAGGFSKDAYLEWISKNLNLSKMVEDSEKIYIPFVWEKQYSIQIDSLEKVQQPKIEVIEESSELTRSNESVSESTQELSSTNVININQASKEALESLSGIGPAYADRIISNRPYNSLQDLVEMSGVPESTIAKFSSQIIF